MKGQGHEAYEADGDGDDEEDDDVRGCGGRNDESEGHNPS